MRPYCSITRSKREIRSRSSPGNRPGVYVALIKIFLVLRIPARVNDLVNKYVEPKISSITVEAVSQHSFRLTIGQSSMRPHVMRSGETYVDDRGKTRNAFHEGQIYIRHGSKTQPARGDDITRLINERVAALLSSLGDAFRKMSLEVGSGSAAIPVRVAMDAPVSITIGDINKSYAYFAKSLGEVLGKGQNWVAAAAEKLSLKGDAHFCYTILAQNGKPAMIRYSELARDRLKLAALDETFDPYNRRKSDRATPS